MLVNGETLPTEKPAAKKEETTEEGYDKKGKKMWVVTQTVCI